MQLESKNGEKNIQKPSSAEQHQSIDFSSMFIDVGPLGAFGDPWGPRGNSCNPWGPLGGLGDPWGHLGNSVRFA